MPSRFYVQAKLHSDVRVLLDGDEERVEEFSMMLHNYSEGEMSPGFFLEYLEDSFGGDKAKDLTPTIARLIAEEEIRVALLQEAGAGSFADEGTPCAPSAGEAPWGASEAPPWMAGGTSGDSSSDVAADAAAEAAAAVEEENAKLAAAFRAQEQAEKADEGERVAAARQEEELAMAASAAAKQVEEDRVATEKKLIAAVECEENENAAAAAATAAEEEEEEEAAAAAEAEAEAVERARINEEAHQFAQEEKRAQKPTVVTTLPVKQDDEMLATAGFQDIRFSDRVPYWCAVGFTR